MTPKQRLTIGGTLAIASLCLMACYVVCGVCIAGSWLLPAATEFIEALR